jgi:hypothetical protein
MQEETRVHGTSTLQMSLAFTSSVKKQNPLLNSIFLTTHAILKIFFYVLRNPLGTPVQML